VNKVGLITGIALVIVGILTLVVYSSLRQYETMGIAVLGEQAKA
jgi:Tfp pilus assembly protein PilE